MPAPVSGLQGFGSLFKKKQKTKKQKDKTDLHTDSTQNDAP